MKRRGVSTTAIAYVAVLAMLSFAAGTIQSCSEDAREVAEKYRPSAERIEYDLDALPFPGEHEPQAVPGDYEVRL